jgi:2-dehydro-3-deoxyphosphogluconate aldolase/(4S)-4-hydroxy-2-oxoglutarate aldolase
MQPSHPDKTDALDRIARAWLVAVVRAESTDQARRIAGALRAGGVSVIEITFTCPDPPAILRALAREGGELLLGAGTVCTRDQARAALDAGARFIVSPGLVEEVVAETRAGGAAAVPGAVTPTEILAALRAGADAIKIFPGSLFGPAYVKALRGPMPDLRIMPTGGVSLANLKEWMEAGAIAVGVGSELTPKAALQAGDWGAITAKARAFVDAIRALGK